MADPLDDKAKPSFYAPRFKVKIGGRDLHEEAGDVLSVQFKDSIKELSGAEFVLNNHQDNKDGRATFKYSNEGGPIDLGQKFELDMGYADSPQKRTNEEGPMLIGEITAFEPQFPAAGSPTLVVRGLDLLHRMRNKPRAGSWVKKTDPEIASEIADRNGLKAKVDTTSPKHPVVPQDNKDDLSFLVE